MRMGDHRSGTGRGRLVQYAATYRMLADHPIFGVGPGQWAIAYPAYARDDDPTYPAEAPVPWNRLPSSDWISIAAEGGLPSLAIVVALGALLLRRAWSRGITKDVHAAALLALLAAIAVLGVFDGVLYRAETAYIAAVALGTMAGACIGATRREIAVRRGPLLFAAVALSVVGVGATGCRLAACIVRSCGLAGNTEKAFLLDPGNYELATHIAKWHYILGRCEPAAAYARTALRLCPSARLPKTILETCARKQTE